MTETENLIQQASADDLRAFLLEQIAQDDDLAMRALNWFSETISPEQLSDLIFTLRHIPQQHEDRSGFISWKNVSMYQQDILKFLCRHVDPMIRQHHDQAATKVLIEAIDLQGIVEMDDEYERMNIIVNCLDRLEEIYPHASKEVQSTILAYAENQLERLCDGCDNLTETFLNHLKASD